MATGGKVKWTKQDVIARMQDVISYGEAGTTTGQDITSALLDKARKRMGRE